MTLSAHRSPHVTAGQAGQRQIVAVPTAKSFDAATGARAQTDRLHLRALPLVGSPAILPGPLTMRASRERTSLRSRAIYKSLDYIFNYE